jgi:hypothetical protein
MKFCNEFLSIDYGILTHYRDEKLIMNNNGIINHTKSVKYQKYLFTINS